MGPGGDLPELGLAHLGLALHLQRGRLCLQLGVEWVLVGGVGSPGCSRAYLHWLSCVAQCASFFCCTCSRVRTVMIVNGGYSPIADRSWSLRTWSPLFNTLAVLVLYGKTALATRPLALGVGHNSHTLLQMRIPWCACSAPQTYMFVSAGQFKARGDSPLRWANMARGAGGAYSQCAPQYCSPL